MRQIFLVLAFLVLFQGCDTTEPTVEPLATPVLVYPSNDTSGVEVAPVLSWKPLDGVSTYQVQVSTRSDFTTIRDSATATVAWYEMESIDEDTRHYWRVRSVKNGETSAWSETRSFSTALINSRIAVGTRLNFELVDMNTQQKDTAYMEIAEQNMTYNGKSRVMKVVLINGSSTTIRFMNYEPNGNFSFYDDNLGWMEMPVGTKEGTDTGIDTLEVTSETVTLQRIYTSYNGSMTTIIQGTSYPIHMATMVRELQYRRTSDGEVTGEVEYKTIFSVSPKLGFLTGFDDTYNDSNGNSSYYRSYLYEIVP